MEVPGLVDHPRREPRSNELDGGPEPYAVTDWTTSLDGKDWFQPLVADGTLYVAPVTGVGHYGTSNYLAAYDAETGEEKWNRTGFSNSAGTLLGERNAYHLAEGIRALDPDTGETVWDRTEWRATSAVAAAGRVYVLTEERGLFALDPRTGETIWKTDELSGRHRLSYGDGILVSSEGTAFDVDDATVRWRAAVGEGALKAVSDGLVYGRETDDSGAPILVARSVNDGSVCWTNSERSGYLGESDGTLAVDGDFAVTTADGWYQGKVAAFDAKTGESAWVHDVSFWLTSVTIANGVAYVGGQHDPGDDDDLDRAHGLVYAIDVASGTPKWGYRLERREHEAHEPVAGLPVVADGRMYVTTGASQPVEDVHYGHLHVLEASDERPDEAHRLLDDVDGSNGDGGPESDGETGGDEDDGC